MKPKFVEMHCHRITCFELCVLVCPGVPWCVLACVCVCHYCPLYIQVVAVEPSLGSVRRLQKAAQLSGTTKYITLVNNGISNERTVVKLDVSVKRP